MPHGLLERPIVPLLGTSGFKFRLTSILETLTSFIYALPHGLLERPRVPLLGTSGFKLRLTSIETTLTSFILAVLEEIFPLQVIFPLIHVSPETCKL